MWFEIITILALETCGTGLGAAATAALCPRVTAAVRGGLGDSKIDLRVGKGREKKKRPVVWVIREKKKSGFFPPHYSK